MSIKFVTAHRATEAFCNIFLVVIVTCNCVFEALWQTFNKQEMFRLSVLSILLSYLYLFNLSFATLVSDVVELNVDNFVPATQRGHEIVLLEFYDPKNSACRKFKSNMEALEKKLNGIFRLTKFDVSKEEHQGLYHEYLEKSDLDLDSVSLPVLLAFEGEKIHPYTGALTTNSVQDFLYDLVTSEAKELTKKKLKKFTQEAPKGPRGT